MEGVDGIGQPIKDAPAASSKEIILTDGQIVALPTLHFSEMTLYHGSPIAGIAAFEIGDQLTIGRGVYFTPNQSSAAEYARWRSNDKTTPTVYEAHVTDAEIADLRSRAAEEQFAKLLKQAILEYVQNTLPNLKGPEEILPMIKEMKKEEAEKVVKLIDSNSWIGLRDLTFGWGDLVSRKLSEQGYKGLMSMEGEPPAVPFHDSIVIFDPQEVLITNQQLAA